MSLFVIPCSSIAQDLKKGLNSGEVASEGESEQEIAWKIIVTQEDRYVEQLVSDFIKNVTIPKSVNKEAVVKLRNLLNEEAQTLTQKDLINLKQVRSIQINDLGAYFYPYFKCEFKGAKKSLFFEKTAGSQRKSGFVFPNTANTMVFLGGKTIKNEKQRQYSGILRAENKDHDVAGLFIKRGKKVLALFRKKRGYEVYEFK